MAAKLKRGPGRAKIHGPGSVDVHLLLTEAEVAQLGTVVAHLTVKSGGQSVSRVDALRSLIRSAAAKRNILESLV